MSKKVFSRGDVVWAPDFFKLSMGSEFGAPNPRPWLVISHDNHPSSGTPPRGQAPWHPPRTACEEYVALSLTTTEREIAVRIQDSDWITGGGPEDSYIVPWNPATLKHGWVGDNRQGQLKENVVETAVEELNTYI